jgi:hypothetical protein
MKNCKQPIPLTFTTATAFTTSFTTQSSSITFDSWPQTIPKNFLITTSVIAKPTPPATK